MKVTAEREEDSWTQRLSNSEEHRERFCRRVLVVKAPALVVCKCPDQSLDVVSHTKLRGSFWRPVFALKFLAVAAMAGW
jgi:hypothetical protein